MFFCGVLWQWAQNVNRDSFHGNFHHILRKRSMSFPFLPKSTEGVLYTTMTCSRMIMMSFKFSLSKPLGKNNVAISQTSSVTFPFRTKHNVCVTTRSSQHNSEAAHLPTMVFYFWLLSIKKIIFLFFPQEDGSPGWF